MDIPKLLAKCFLFRDLEPKELERLGRITSVVNHGKGEMVFGAGVEGTAMYLIDTGSVLVSKDGQEIARLASGSHFGELALLDGQPRSATVEAAERTDLLLLPRDRFLELLASDAVLSAKIHRSFCRYLAARLRRSNEQTAFFRDLADR